METSERSRKSNTVKPNLQQRNEITVNLKLLLWKPVSLHLHVLSFPGDYIVYWDYFKMVIKIQGKFTIA